MNKWAKTPMRAGYWFAADKCPNQATTCLLHMSRSYGFYLATITIIVNIHTIRDISRDNGT